MVRMRKVLYSLVLLFLSYGLAKGTDYQSSAGSVEKADTNFESKGKKRARSESETLQARPAKRERTEFIVPEDPVERVEAELKKSPREIIQRLVWASYCSHDVQTILRSIGIKLPKGWAPHYESERLLELYNLEWHGTAGIQSETLGNIAVALQASQQEHRAFRGFQYKLPDKYPDNPIVLFVRAHIEKDTKFAEEGSQLLRFNVVAHKVYQILARSHEYAATVHDYVEISKATKMTRLAKLEERLQTRHPLITFAKMTLERLEGDHKTAQMYKEEFEEQDLDVYRGPFKKYNGPFKNVMKALFQGINFGFDKFGSHELYLAHRFGSFDPVYHYRNAMSYSAHSTEQVYYLEKANGYRKPHVPAVSALGAHLVLFGHFASEVQRGEQLLLSAAKDADPDAEHHLADIYERDRQARRHVYHPVHYVEETVMAIEVNFESAIYWCLKSLLNPSALDWQKSWASRKVGKLFSKASDTQQQEILKTINGVAKESKDNPLNQFLVAAFQVERNNIKNALEWCQNLHTAPNGSNPYQWAHSLVRELAFSGDKEAQKLLENFQQGTHT